MGLNDTAVDQRVEVTAERIAGGRCDIAEMDGRLAGTIVVKPTEAQSECEYITRPGLAAAQKFAVDPKVQGRGLGRALLQACEAWAKARGFEELSLGHSRQARHLIALYTGLGCKHVGFEQWSGKVYRSVVLGEVLQSVGFSSPTEAERHQAAAQTRPPR